jgi:hypothetical protein
VHVLTIRLSQQDAELAGAQAVAQEAMRTAPFTPLSTLQPAEGRAKAKLPSPPTFQNDRKEYPVWRRKMRAKIAVDAGFIGIDHYTQVNYILVFLLGEAVKFADFFV